MISPGNFFIFFEIFIFWGVRGGGKRAKNSHKMKNNNCICHTTYLRNSIAYDHVFWSTCVKWWYFQAFFKFFWKLLIFRAVTGWEERSKRAKNSPKWKITITSVTCHISGTSFMVHLWKIWYLQGFFHFFKILVLWFVKG